jgi:hypothetical protein
MLEKDIEQYLVRKVKAAGGLCEKFTSPGRRSVPDRIITMLGGRIFFVELKAPGKKPTVKQLADHKRRLELGCNVLVIDTKEGVDDLIAQLTC